jgi:RNA-directed DNA polymerase
MTFEDYEKKFRILARESGYSEHLILRCLSYAKPLLDQNLPVIFNTSNLSALVGYKKNYIKKAVLYPTYFYREFTIKKRGSAGSRTISEPLPSLKEIQSWILENILYEIPVSRFAKAYVRDRTLIDNVKYHKGKHVIVCLDIKDFFSSIRRIYIEKIFLDLHYSSNVANLLSKLVCCNEHLPQGAVTSPYLSNLYMRQFDKNLSEFCTNSNIRFTRYADDITLSGNFDPQPVIDFVSELLQRHDLTVKKEKTRIMYGNDRQIVTGVIVNKKIQMPREKRDKIRQEIFFIKKLGPIKHLENTQNSRKNYLRHLLGKITFALFLNPRDSSMKEYSAYVRGLIKNGEGYLNK